MAIAIHTLTENDKGRMVEYIIEGHSTEEGVISSWNENFVFVRYKGDMGSKATRPEDLSFSLR